ncbi:MAG: hypothetical protein KJ970_16610 [Candidatus Eisenbacteria bacterium]|uniref:Uncharacterized protein n=1 Tax=Eiseniibacteriota bacterium TaxID=2212470 RepID=A0A948S2A7_UNCEI|nr:hypothetical protein [Candidatus Eisenbacteria bacterium]MBU1950488.1 hypothetical protein [Candidatus Eisenbacteria bacterium]MBU2692539.1 hypothetical protein [Candidatus Eisenbacteria bacterium]
MRELDTSAPIAKRTIWTRLMAVDRRIIFLAVALSVALPLIYPIGLPVKTANESRAYFKEMDQLNAGDVIMFSFDYEPDTMAELDPMSLTTWRHAFRKDLKIIALTMYAGGTGVAERIMRQVAGEYGKVYGEDYIFLGYNPDWSGTMLRLGESIKATYPTDQYGTPSESFPILQHVDRYGHIKLLVSVSASALSEYWAIWAGGKYGQRMISGNTAVQAVLIYPYFQTDQISGFLGGLKGAAEYESLVGIKGEGTRGMDAQSTAHALMVLFILLGNVGYVMNRRRRTQ